jgi:hypothetical protein
MFLHATEQLGIAILVMCTTGLRTKKNSITTSRIRKEQTIYVCVDGFIFPNRDTSFNEISEPKHLCKCSMQFFFSLSTKLPVVS